MRLEERFIEHLKSLVPDAVQAHYLLAVSGGKDSTALAHLFHFRNRPLQLPSSGRRVRQRRTICKRAGCHNGQKAACQTV